MEAVNKFYEIYFALFLLKSLKISIQNTDTKPISVLKPTSEKVMLSNRKNVLKVGIISKELVSNKVNPIMRGTRLFLYFKVVNIE